MLEDPYKRFHVSNKKHQNVTDPMRIIGIVHFKSYQRENVGVKVRDKNEL
jgi:hypothetical protein